MEGRNDPDIEAWLEAMDAKVSCIGDNKGPVFVASGVPRDRFMKMYNESRAYKRNMLWKGGELFIQADYTDHHEQVRYWLYGKLVMEFHRLGIVYLGSRRQISLSPGGLMEVADRCQQVDLFILEKTEQERNFKNAQVVLAAQIVYANEDPQAVFNDMEVLVSRDGAKVALGIIVGKPCKVFYRDRTSAETQIIEAADGNVIRFNWQELFERVSVQGETLIDLGLLEDHASSI